MAIGWTSTWSARWGDDETDALLDRAVEAGLLSSVGDSYRFLEKARVRGLANCIAPHQRAAIHREVAQRLTAMNTCPTR